MRKRCTEKMPEDPQRHAAAIASAYPIARWDIPAQAGRATAPIGAGRQAGFRSPVSVYLIEKQVHDETGHRDVRPERERPTCEPSVVLKTPSPNQIYEA